MDLRSGRAGESVETGYKCLCCKDSGLVLPEIIRGHGLYENPVFGSYESTMTGDIGFLCQRRGCNGNSVQVPNPIVTHAPKPGDRDDEEPTAFKTVARFADYAVSKAISPEQCQMAHNLEWQRMRELDEQVTRSAEVANLRSEIVKIGSPMPPSQPRSAEWTDVGKVREDKLYLCGVPQPPEDELKRDRASKVIYLSDLGLQGRDHQDQGFDNAIEVESCPIDEDIDF